MNTIRRRDFILTASAATASVAFPERVKAQEGGEKPVPTRQAKVERLFKAPDIHPNALESAPDGLWIGDQVSERVFKVDWQTAKCCTSYRPNPTTPAASRSAAAISG
jgi:hypothetical protein